LKLIEYFFLFADPKRYYIKFDCKDKHLCIKILEKVVIVGKMIPEFNEEFLLEYLFLLPLQTTS